jgi:2-dehydropantoate 2-reductase
MAHLAPCVGTDTSILPLLNGVDARDRISALFPSTDVWNGCIYILARRTAPGVITVTRDLHQLYFGSERDSGEKLQRVEAMFRASGINAELVDDISRRVWEKFIFISAWATTTTYFDANVAGVIHDETRVHVLRNLLQEIQAVTRPLDVGLPDDVVSTTLRRIESLPPEATSSMQADFQRGGQTELESLTAVVVRVGKEHGVPTPQHEAVLAALRARAATAGR